MPLWLGYPLTILIVVFIINAINLIDGIDGLASGLCSIACLFYGLTFFMLHQYVYAMLAFATLGVLVPFFYYNVFGNAKHGRKIFMGDTGSLTIGMMLCFLSLKLTMCGLDDNTGNVHPMVLAFSPLLVHAVTWSGFTCIGYATERTRSCRTRTISTISCLLSE